MSEICKRCADKQLWYKLYADDLVLITAHEHLKDVLTILREVSIEYNLKINPKKSGIFAAKGHLKLKGDIVEGIPP